MGKPTGFIEFRREKQPYRPIEERVRDWHQVMRPWPEEKLRGQGARCMDCGVPFCHQGCPLGNFIPDWNDLVYHDRWREALVRLHATNNFPEFTGTLCPAPCEGSCVLAINDQAVNIRAIELAVIERGFEEGWVKPQIPSVRTGKRVAVVGSGPAGLAAAHQLNQFGHQVVVFERADRIGGLLRYGIPEFKMEKRLLDRRLELIAKEGVEFRAGVNVGKDLPVSQLRRDFHALMLAGGSTVPRDLPVPGRELKGIHYAMDYLIQQNRVLQGESIPAESRISAVGKRVAIIGGGDTGADCLGTVHRHGAASVHQLELLPRPPDRRAEDNPWPEWPMILRSSAAHEEGGFREYSVNTSHFSGEGGWVRALHGHRAQMVKDGGRIQFKPTAGSEFTLPVELVILAMGFVGPERGGLLSELGVRMSERGTVARDQNWMTSVEGVFVAGDMQRGQSLIVWAIADGRNAARGVDTYLRGTACRSR